MNKLHGCDRTEVHKLFGPSDRNEDHVMQHMIFSALYSQQKVEDNIILYELNFLEWRIKKRFCVDITSLFIACGLILLPLELFWIVVSCKIVNSSISFNLFIKSPSFKRSFLYFLTFSKGWLCIPTIGTGVIWL